MNKNQMNIPRRGASTCDDSESQKISNLESPKEIDMVGGINACVEWYFSNATFFLLSNLLSWYLFGVFSFEYSY